MKKSIVFFIAVGCFFLSNCADVGSYSSSKYPTSRYYGSSSLYVRPIIGPDMEERLDNCEKRLKEIDDPMFGRLTSIEERVKRLEENRDIQATYELTVGKDRLKKIEKSLEEL